MLRLLDKITPPGDAITKWRWFIAIAVVLLLVNVAMGRGLLGIGAYASEGALQTQGTKIDRLLKLQIAATIRELKKEECRSNGNKTLLQDTIEDYQQQYIDVAGKRYPLPRCET